MKVGLLLVMLAQASAAQPTIYRCSDAGGVIYSDRPCGPGADTHEIDDSRITVFTPSPVAERASAKPSAKQPKAIRPKAGRPADPAQHRSECTKLAQALRDTRTKMRSGYGVQEGERLKARQRQLNERRRTQKCG